LNGARALLAGRAQLLLAAESKLRGLCETIDAMALLASSLARPTSATQAMACELCARLLMLKAASLSTSTTTLVDFMRDVFVLADRLERRKVSAARY
jgi:hypothetical protein